MLELSYFKPNHPKTKKDAISRAGLRLQCQVPFSKITEYAQICFNSIQLTDIQKDIRDKLSEGNSILRGSYGVGKSVAIISAIKELIKEFMKENATNKNIKILFISAQSLLTSEDLQISPFLCMVQNWIEEISKPFGLENPQILSYTKFLNKEKGIADVMRTRTSSHEGVIFYSYLLKHKDLDHLNTATSPPTSPATSQATLPITSLSDKFDVIVLEETHAFKSRMMQELVEAFEIAARKESKEKNFKVWMCSNAEILDAESGTCESFKIIPSKEKNKETMNLRNTHAIAKLAEAINTDIAPERYPSLPMPTPAFKCNIPTDYKYEPDDNKRLRKIVKRAKSWERLLSKSPLLIIDCEDSGLQYELQNEDLPVNMNTHKFEPGGLLFLKHSDPVEAIVAGAEWHLMIIHIKLETMHSINGAKLFNKRVISRATTKVIIFSDRKILQAESKSTLVDRDVESSPKIGSTEEQNSEEQLRDKLDVNGESEQGKFINGEEAGNFYVTLP